MADPAPAQPTELGRALTRAAARLPGKLAARQLRLSAQHAVEDPVMPPAALEGGAADNPLPAEPGFLQRPLLGDVVNLGAGLDPVHLRVREQVSRQEALCLGAVPAAARLGCQRNPDLPAEGRPGGRALMPADESEAIAAARP